MLSVLSDNGKFAGRVAEAWISAACVYCGGIPVYEKRKKRTENFFCDCTGDDGASTFRFCVERV